MPAGLTFNGMPLVLPQASILAEIRRIVDLEVFNPFQSRFVGVPVSGIPMPQIKRPSIDIGKVYWPTGISRFGYGFFLVAQSQMTAFPDAVYQNDPGFESGNLVLDDGVNSVSLAMYPLALQPVFSYANGNDSLYLLTLVDWRYRYWDIAQNYFAFAHPVDPPYYPIWAPGMTPTQFIANVANLYQFPFTPNVSVTVDAISTLYANPGVRWGANPLGQPFCLYADAACFAYGLRAVFAYAGNNLHFQNVDNAVAQMNANIATGYPLLAGGYLNYVEVFKNLPYLIYLFTSRDASGPTAAFFTDIDNCVFPWTGLTSPYPTAINSTAKSLHVEDVLPGFTTPIEAYVNAQDWYSWQTSPVNAVFRGIVPWVLTGLDDSIEWHWTENMVCTIVRRPPFNEVETGHPNPLFPLTVIGYNSSESVVYSPHCDQITFANGQFIGTNITDPNNPNASQMTISLAGQSVTITYQKSLTETGTLTFTNGILTANT